MVKSCREIAEDIEELRRNIHQDRLTEITLADFSERKKCKSPDILIVCTNCDCWKVYNDKNAVES